VPERGHYLKNSQGTAVGLRFDLGPKTLVALPGPPRELQAMVTQELVPLFQQRFGLRSLGATLTLRFVGVGQSQVSQVLQEEVGVPGDMIVTSVFEGSRVDFTFSLPENSAGESARLRVLEAAIRRHLDEYFYADDGSALEQVVLRQLATRGKQLAVAEVGSGGVLAASLNGFAEASTVLSGAFVAPTEERMAELLELPAAERPAPDDASSWAGALAEAAARHTGADWAVAIGRFEGGGAGGKLRLALRAGDRIQFSELGLRDLTTASRLALVTQVLDRLRRFGP
jgi:nicotinamide-nucleotide amidase